MRSARSRRARRIIRWHWPSRSALAVTLATTAGAAFMAARGAVVFADCEGVHLGRTFVPWDQVYSFNIVDGAQLRFLVLRYWRSGKSRRVVTVFHGRADDTAATIERLGAPIERSW